MNPGDARAAETREWLAKAAEDLASACDLARTGHPSNALFFCQQAAEKSLKAFLVWHDRRISRTHDLESLGSICRDIDAGLAMLTSEAEVLTGYAWKLRYPGADYIPDADEVESMYALAARVVSGIKSRLPV